LLNTLPLNYDDITLKTIERIDVIWMRGRSYSGHSKSSTPLPYLFAIQPHSSFGASAGNLSVSSTSFPFRRTTSGIESP